MRITVKVGDVYAHLTPDGCREHELELADGTTALDAVANLGLDRDANYLILLNDAVLKRAERPSLALRDGDRLAVLAPLKGG